MKRAFLTLLVFLPMSLHADDDLDWELDLNIRQRSTISDFPLQEIGQEELSNAAIEGALQTTSAYREGRSGKPAHEQEKEANDKREVSEVSDKEKDALERGELPVILVAPPVVDFQQPVYQAPNGREYGHLETTTIER